MVMSAERYLSSTDSANLLLLKKMREVQTGAIDAGNEKRIKVLLNEEVAGLLLLAFFFLHVLGAKYLFSIIPINSLKIIQCDFLDFFTF